jgi:hypothetical protein
MPTAGEVCVALVVMFLLSGLVKLSARRGGSNAAAGGP